MHSFVSYATLLGADDEFLAQKYDIQYVASGRDMLREFAPPAGKKVVLFANPDFNLPSTGNLARKITYADIVALNRQIFGNQGGEQKPDSTPVAPEAAAQTLVAAFSAAPSEHRNVERWRFQSIPGTQKESEELAKKFGQWGCNSVSFTGKDATKQALFNIHSPYILHLATHGFLQKEDPTAAQSDVELAGNGTVIKSQFFRNPMHRSGLALAGAETTIEDWKKDLVPPVDNDGILTAEDVSTLDLEGTWLVTLSACDTGSGQAKAGEGVLGLRRGFVEAGAQNLLMTLWPISDEMTVQIMRDFYDAAHDSGNAPEALAEVQRNWLVKLRTDEGLTQAVNLAGPFIMSSQGKP